ncbi:MAG: class I SAM-dependent methyltransferase [Stappiaceae bacterium]
MLDNTEMKKPEESKPESLRRFSFHEHGILMDRTYRHMKHVYDISRPTFLAGRAQARKDALKNGTPLICEVGCGTGRNLILMAASPSGKNIKFTGFDVSLEMTGYAQARICAAELHKQIEIKRQDFLSYSNNTNQSCSFLFSYSLSMTPNWKDLLRVAANACRKNGGAIVTADFSTMDDWPGWIRERLRKNLSYFHVYPRYELVRFLENDEVFTNTEIKRTPKFGGYAAVLNVRF